MWGITAHTLTNIGNAFTSAKVRNEFSSIVGITVVTQEAVVRGAGYALVILGFVSLALAIVNLFPFLPLDGGHVLWSVAEKVRGRRVSLAAMWRFSSIGIVLLAFLVINGVSNDISRLGGLESSKWTCWPVGEPVALRPVGRLWTKLCDAGR